MRKEYNTWTDAHRADFTRISDLCDTASNVVKEWDEQGYGLFFEDENKRYEVYCDHDTWSYLAVEEDKV